jgi:hypothetical protein
MFGIGKPKSQNGVNDELIHAVLTARKAITAADAQREDIEAQITDVARNVKLTEAKSLIADRKKAEVEDQYVRHEVDKAALDAAVIAARTLRDELEVQRGILRACKDGLCGVKNNEGILRMNLETAETRFYRAVAEYHFGLARERALEHLQTGITALLCARAPVTLEGIFKTHLNGFWPSDAAVRQKFAAKIEEELNRVGA